MDYQKTAAEILRLVGGKDNVATVTHCMTRLRFTLKDRKLAQVEELKKLSGVQGVVTKNSQFQIVIGTDVGNLCDAIQKLGNFKDDAAAEQQGEKSDNLIMRFFGTLTAIFQPVIPALAGSGMIKALLALLVATHVISNGSQTYAIFYAFGDALFSFMPFILAYSAAKHFACNPYISATLAGVLLHASFTALNTGDPVLLFGFIPVTMVSYGGSVVPILLIVWVQSKIEPWANKISPKAVKIFLAPMITIIATGIIGVVIAAAVSFVIASPIVRSAQMSDIEKATDKMRELKGTAEAAVISDTVNGLIVFACDAGMGSSAMGATRFLNRIKAERPDLTVQHSSVDNVPGNADIVVCQRVLSERARRSAPQAQIVTIDNFLDDPALDSLYDSLTNLPCAAQLTEPMPEPPAKKEDERPRLSMNREDIQLGCKPTDRVQAIRDSGALLQSRGYVDASYVDAMVERDKLTSVYIGMGIAIPHGTNEAKESVERTGVVFQQYPEGVDFDGERAQLVFGIAGKGDEHLEVLANICKILEDEEVLEKLKTTTDIDWVLSILS